MFGFERSNPGSVFVEVLVLILAVIFCGAIALMIVRTEDMKAKPTSSVTSKPKSVSATSTTPSDTPPQGSPPVGVVTTTPGTSPQSSDGSFNISSLGIDITLPSSMSDLTYSSSTSASGVVTVNFSTATITKDAPTCSASSGQGAFDSIIRANGNFPSNAGANEGLIKQEPSYYIAYILPSGPCATNLSPSIQSLLDQEAQDFYSALSTIQVT